MATAKMVCRGSSGGGRGGVGGFSEVVVDSVYVAEIS